MALIKPKTLPRTIKAIKARNKKNGGLFFDREVLEFQFTRVMNVVHKGHFITSEGTQRNNVSRTYTIRQCDVDGNISGVAKYDSFTTAYADLKTL